MGDWMAIAAFGFLRCPDQDVMGGEAWESPRGVMFHFPRGTAPKARRTESGAVEICALPQGEQYA